MQYVFGTPSCSHAGNLKSQLASHPLAIVAKPPLALLYLGLSQRYN
jgi:hypothetical protein